MEKCNCELCQGKYLQVDPVDCGCTECITGKYRPAINEEDYQEHQNKEMINHCDICNCDCGCHPCKHTK